MVDNNDNVIGATFHATLQGAATMFNPRTDRPADSKDLPKPALKPALYDPPAPAPKPAINSGLRAGLSPQPAPPKESVPVAPPNNGATPTTSSTSSAATSTEPGGSKLFIGVNIKLKGVEISDCDVLVIEGQVEATVNSKVMQIDEPGTLTGTALIDVAEIRGEFSGELTARTRLVVHGTGRVSGTIRYGKLIVEEGGELTGDVKRLNDVEAQPQRMAVPQNEARHPSTASAEPVPTLTNTAYPGASRTYSS
jgi:cytoskeletal protein CcmA (bactofilin family)